MLLPSVIRRIRESIRLLCVVKEKEKKKKNCTDTMRDKMAGSVVSQSVHRDAVTKGTVEAGHRPTGLYSSDSSAERNTIPHCGDSSSVLEAKSGRNGGGGRTREGRRPGRMEQDQDPPRSNLALSHVRVIPFHPADQISPHLDSAYFAPRSAGPIAKPNTTNRTDSDRAISFYHFRPQPR